MPININKFTLRDDDDLLKKLRYVADYNVRSANREIKMLIKRHVENFEKSKARLNLNDSYEKVSVN